MEGKRIGQDLEKGGKERVSKRDREEDFGEGFWKERGRDCKASSV